MCHYSPYLQKPTRMTKIILRFVLLAVFIAQVVACPDDCHCLLDNTVKCVDVGLDDIRDDIPRETKVLEIRNGNVSKLNNESFVNLTALEEISFDNNQLRDINRNTFTELTKLRVLKISNNPLSTISEVFSGLVNLQDLEITRCGLSTLSNATFAGQLSLLKRLVLDDNAITEFLPGTFDDLTSLEELSVVGNRLTQVPDAALFASTLKKLSLSRNEIPIIEGNQFSDFNSLQELHLCGLEAVKAGLPDDAFVGIEDTLVTLSIAGNELTSTPSAVQNLTKLTRLDISNNKLNHLEYETFANLKGMQRLSLSCNEFRDIPGSVFSLYSNLTELYLNNNSISTISSESFSSCSNLRYIHLENNNISEIAKDSFCGLENLRSIDLSGNALRALPDGVFGDGSLTVKLDDNPWRCDCQILWLSGWLRANNGSYNNPGPDCLTPPNMKMRDLTSPAGCTAPNMTTETPYESTEQGSNITLSCNVIGYPTPDVSWVTSSGCNVTMETGNSGAGGKYKMQATSLIVINVDKADEGNYTCWGKNMIGNASVTVVVTLLNKIGTTSSVPSTAAPKTAAPKQTTPRSTSKITSASPSTQMTPSLSSTLHPRAVPPKDEGMSDPEVGMIIFSVFALVAIGISVFVHWICKKRNAEKDEEEQSLAFENRMFSSLDDYDAGLI